VNAPAAGLALPGPVDPRRFQVLELEPGALDGLSGMIGRAAPA
jgi:predicted N-acetyltransferase YhbS